MADKKVSFRTEDGNYLSAPDRGAVISKISDDISQSQTCLLTEKFQLSSFQGGVAIKTGKLFFLCVGTKEEIIVMPHCQEGGRFTIHPCGNGISLKTERNTYLAPSDKSFRQTTRPCPLFLEMSEGIFSLTKVNNQIFLA